MPAGNTKLDVFIHCSCPPFLVSIVYWNRTVFIDLPCESYIFTEEKEAKGFVSAPANDGCGGCKRFY
jgi:hypothetical protein